MLGKKGSGVLYNHHRFYCQHRKLSLQWLILINLIALKTEKGKRAIQKKILEKQVSFVQANKCMHAW